ncbi:MAG: serine--tRNA ligase [Patescibacteria group bacterium]|nr:serine--tRNA ligase [Patescibacteria group bacterium]
MLDIKFIEENKEDVQKSCKLRNIDCNVDDLIELNKERVALLQEVEELNAQKNQLNEKMKQASEQERAKIIKKGKEVKKKLSQKDPKAKKMEKEFWKEMSRMPNVLSEDVPVGKDDTENMVARKVGEPTVFDFEPKDHVDLGEALGIIDVKTAAKVSGSRFNYIKGGAALLQFAIIQFVFEIITDEKIIGKLAKKVGNLSDKPFVPVIPPVIVKSEIMKKMDRFDPIEDRYYLKDDDSLLVGSAEHSLGPIFASKVIDEQDLPVRLIGYSTVFRREAGTYGKDTRGILRCHQFDKLEMESFTTADNGLVEQDLIVAIQEYLVGELKIPYQVVQICTGDIGKPDFRQIDIECWIPGQGKYRETHTSDYMTDFQARRLSTKVKRIDGNTELVHMNDATAFAIGRILIAIIENYQQVDGSILVPEILQKYMPRGMTKIEKKK